jgi:hypothetical protein
MRAQNILSSSLIAAGLALALCSAASASIAITIDKNTQHMSVAVDGTARYEWPVSTGRPGYDTPNGTYKVNRMDADHLSQEWDNAPMPHSMFFDMRGHAIHGFFDVKHLGLPVSHGCVRLSPANAATLFAMVKAEGMANTTVVVEGHTPGGQSPAVARQTPPAAQQPAQITPGYGEQNPPPYGQPAYGQPAYNQPTYNQPAYGQPAYNQPGYDRYGQSTFPPQPAPYYARPAYGQPYGGGQYSGQQYPAPQPGYQRPQYGQPFTPY